MSLFDISYAGLKSQSAAIQITSNNVANASTTAYKARESLFVDQYFKAVQSGGSSGVQEFGTKRVDIQGSMKASTSALDLGIQGQGMFRMASMATGSRVRALSVFLSACFPGKANMKARMQVMHVKVHAVLSTSPLCMT